jgi:protein ImuA
MRMIAAHSGKLQMLEISNLKASSAHVFTTGLTALDALAPKQSWAHGAVHELLFDPPHGQPKFVAAQVAGAASALMPIIWSDPRGELYPPALASLGFDLTQLFILRPASHADEIWAITESLRCPGVGAVIAAPEKLSRIEARRLQLAAETGGSVGIFLRPRGRGDSIYAAATRWLVAPYPGERTVQRWTIQLLHGHGGRVHQTIFLEWCRESRETHSVRAIEKLADRPIETTTPPRVPLRATG